MAVLASVALFGAACSGGSGGAATGSEEDFCGRMEELMQREELDVTDNPAAAEKAAGEMRQLAQAAPPEVAGSLETFADVMDDLAALEAEGDDGGTGDGGTDEGGMEAFGEIMALMFDPEFIEAGTNLSEYLVEQCGFDPETVDQQFGTAGGFGDGTDPEGEPGAGFETEFGDDFGSEGEISLDDVDAVEQAHSEESWSSKVVSTLVSASSVEIMGRGPDDEYIDSEPMSEAEALQACEALRDAFAGEHPDLEVRVGNGETTLVEGTATDSCAAV